MLGYFRYFRSLLRLNCWSGGPTRGYTDPEPAGLAGCSNTGVPSTDAQVVCSLSPLVSLSSLNKLPFTLSLGRAARLPCRVRAWNIDLRYAHSCAVSYMEPTDEEALAPPPPPPPQPPPVIGGPACGEVREHLDSPVRVGLTDGRVSAAGRRSVACQ